ncbi:hypothetical protein Lalb_Chr02g0157921 [Lupinus albus]|uniref:Uncharacterized protein n=1 Tax=Lupinus albus TaxID=3870 RepID=A0A6A4R1I9_LUPAL|nr:hypothetical protein Lalb_Chr02g0157921 [Lupinus albus]
MLSTSSKVSYSLDRQSTFSGTSADGSNSSQTSQGRLQALSRHLKKLALLNLQSDPLPLFHKRTITIKTL